MRRLSEREYTALSEIPQQSDVRAWKELPLADWPAGRFMRVRDIARIVRVHPETVRRWVRAGKLRAIRLPGENENKTLRIDEAEFARFLEEGECQDPANPHASADGSENLIGTSETERRFSRRAQKIAMERADG